MFESTRKKKKDKKHLIGSAVVADHAAVEMTEKKQMWSIINPNIHLKIGKSFMIIIRR